MRWTRINKRRSRVAAISEIVATVLILAATVGIGAVLLSVSTGSLSVGVLNQQNQANLANQQIQERVVVYDVWFHTVNNVRDIELHVFNYGQVVVHLISLYANTTGSLAPFGNFTSNFPNGVYISPGQQLKLVIGFGYVKNTVYSIMLVSDVGSTFPSYWTT